MGECGLLADCLIALYCGFEKGDFSCLLCKSWGDPPLNAAEAATAAELFVVMFLLVDVWVLLLFIEGWEDK